MQVSSLFTKLLVVLIKISPSLVQETVRLLFHSQHNGLAKAHKYFTPGKIREIMSMRESVSTMSFIFKN